MFKRIIYILKKDFTLNIRDNYSIYMILFPVIVSLVITLILPSMGGNVLTFAVQEEKVSEDIINKLSDFGNIIKYSTDKEVRDRVNKLDDVIGITKNNGDYSIIFEGNESLEIRGIMPIIIEDVLSPTKLVEFEYVSLGDSKSLIKEYILSFLLITCIFMAAAITAFNIVEDKESLMINALNVSPLKMTEYSIARAIMTILMGLILGLIVTFILAGLSVNYLKIILGIVVSSLVSIILAFLIGGLANNQLSAIGIMKGLFFVYVGLPSLSLILSDNWVWVLFPLPNYWVLNIFQNLLVEEQMIGYWLSILIATVLSIVYFLIMIPFIHKKIKLR